MKRASQKRLSKSQRQLITQGVYLLIGALLILVGIACLDVQKISQDPRQPAPPVCVIK
jgi:hypothetical protein